MRLWLRNNSLSLFFGALFLAAVFAQSLVGLRAYNAGQLEHDSPTVSYARYVASAAALALRVRPDVVYISDPTGVPPGLLAARIAGAHLVYHEHDSPAPGTLQPWLARLRAAWMAQELLTTFEKEITELTLRPGTGGIFEVTANDVLVWSRKGEGRFPEITELKQRVRDVIAPDRDLGHSDKPKPDVG